MPIRRAFLWQIAITNYINLSHERFRTELTLDPPGATSDQVGVPYLDEDYLILSTIHSARSAHWPHCESPSA